MDLVSPSIVEAWESARFERGFPVDSMTSVVSGITRSSEYAQKRRAEEWWMAIVRIIALQETRGFIM